MRVEEAFVKNMKEIRAFLSMTQAELARRSVLTPSAISQIEDGKRTPSLLSAWKISRALCCDFEGMFKGVKKENVT